MFSFRYLIFALLMGGVTAHAQDVATPTPTTAAGCAEPSCPLASRGAAVVTIADLRAKLRTLEKKQQDALLSDARQLSNVIENLLVTRQIALQADMDKAAQDPILQARLAQVRDEIISVYRLDEVRAERIKGNFDTLAKEHYLTNKASMVRPREVTVRHLLVDTKNRTDAQALEVAQTLAAELKGADQARFTDVVIERSDDPSKGINGGIFTVVEGDTRLDPGFVTGAMALTRAGEISPPVKSSYGYHLLQAMELKPAGTVPFEEAKPTIVEKLRQDARRRIVSEYRGELMAEDETKFFPENLQTVILDDKPEGE